ncbi:AAA family ATPase [Psychromonas sp. KJ10-10]|uniref:AAA family ATPase n=1 Tax=Psychromonas sp. KJ10-10 TaxID=3391823 RepID=UPI0039B36C5B
MDLHVCHYIRATEAFFPTASTIVTSKCTVLACRAKDLAEACNDPKRPFIALQNYDQETLFGRVNLQNGEQISTQLGVISNYKDGTVVLHISSLLVNPNLWFLLKSFLLNHRIPSQGPVNSDKLRGEIYTQNNQILNSKIILVANRYQLDELTQIDPDFSQINTLFAEISADIKRNDENLQHLSQYCQSLITRKGLSPLSDEAFNSLFKYLARLCDHQNKLLFLQN